GCVGCRLPSWQEAHTRGIRTFSNCGLFEPCGSWQFAQFSITGGCGQREGPRRSVWQLMQFSLGVVWMRCFGLGVPCGLWQLVQVTLPSRYGMCEERCNCALRIWWHCRHNSGCAFCNPVFSVSGEL